MARALTHAIPSGTLEAAIRTHFGLAQSELARYLGISAGQVAHLEAGRRLASPAINKRLHLLAQLLPPPEGTGLPAPVFTPSPRLAAEALPVVLPAYNTLPAGPLRKRLRQIAAQAAGIRLALHQASKGAVLQQRRQWGLTVLRASAPVGDPTGETHFTQWLATLAADVAAAAPSPAAEAAQVLQLVRLLALELEAAALDQLLGEQ